MSQVATRAGKTGMEIVVEVLGERVGCWCTNWDIRRAVVDLLEADGAGKQDVTEWTVADWTRRLFDAGKIERKSKRVWGVGEVVVYRAKVEAAA